MLAYPVFLALQLLFTIGVALLLAVGDRILPGRPAPGRSRAGRAVLGDAGRLRDRTAAPARCVRSSCSHRSRPYVTAYHDVFYYRRWPSPETWILAILYASSRSWRVSG